MIPRVQQVMRQTRERIFKGNTHVAGKLVSLFEPHTEIIRKGKAAKPTEFGKMVKIQEAEEQIVTHYEVYDERPSDCDLLSRRSTCTSNSWAALPRLVTADAASSPRNEAAAHARASSAWRFPTAPPRVQSARSWRRSAGSATPRNGAPAAKAASAC